MSKLFQFKLDDTIMTDPANWEVFVPNTGRHAFYKTVLTTISDKKVEFIKEAKNYIDEKFEELGVLAQTEFEVLIHNASTESYDSYLKGSIDYSQLRKLTNKTEVGLQPSTFEMNLLSRDKMNLDLQALKDLNGDAITAFGDETIDVTLDTQKITKVYDGEHGVTDDYVQDDFISPFRAFYFLPDQSTIDEKYFSSEGSTGEFQLVFSGDYWKGKDYPGLITESEDELTISVDCRIEITLSANGTTASAPPTASLRINGTTLDSVTFDEDGGETQYIDYTGDTVISGYDARKVSFYINLYNPTNINDGGLWTIKMSNGSTIHTDIHIEQISTYPDTTCKGMLAWEYFLRIIQKITGRNDCLRSSLLGRTDGEVYTYGSDGALSSKLFTNAYQVREFPLADYPIITKLQDAINEINAITPVGLGIVYESGVPYVSIEKIQDFFDTSTPTITLKSGKEGVAWSPALDYIFGEVQCGFSEYKNEKNGILGTPHSSRTFNTGLDQAINKTYTAVSRAVVSGHLIETLRRDNYNLGFTKDNRSDNKAVIIDVQRDGMGGWERVKDDDFSTINNIEHEDTQYNLTMTPARNIRNHAPWILAGLVKRMNSSMDDTFIRFQTGDANLKLETQLSGDILIGESDDFDISDLDDSTPLFDAEIGTLNTTISREVQAQLRSEPEKAIYIDDNGEITKVFVENMKITSLLKGTAQLDVLKTYE